MVLVVMWVVVDDGGGDVGRCSVVAYFSVARDKNLRQ